jgi:hypothetical protein
MAKINPRFIPAAGDHGLGRGAPYSTFRDLKEGRDDLKIYLKGIPF